MVKIFVFGVQLYIIIAMKQVTTKIFFALLFIIMINQSVFGYISEADSLKLIARLDSFYVAFPKFSNDRDLNLLEPRLTEESIEWFEDILDAVASADSLDLSKRPFFEVISILGLRYYHRERLLEDLEINTAFRFFATQGYMKQLFGLKDLGGFWIEKERYGFRGLAKAPSIPIFRFELVHDQWRLQLPETLEVISRSSENLGIKKGWSSIDAALKFLDKLFVKSIIDERLLRP
jgi:hypothetical protein